MGLSQTSTDMNRIPKETSWVSKLKDVLARISTIIDAVLLGWASVDVQAKKQPSMSTRATLGMAEGLLLSSS